MKVLLVEDDQFHAAYLRETVQKALPEAEEIVLARDGHQGETEARRGAIGAIVMDLQMRGRNGIEAARTIWRERPATRILFWSNYSDEAYLRGISRIVPKESAYGYVLKTASNDRLHLALRSVLVEGQIVVDREVHQFQQRQIRPVEVLTEAEYAVLVDVSLGLSDRMVAQRQGMSMRTVQNRLLSLYDKLEVERAADGDMQMNKRSRAVARALALRVINPEALETAEGELQRWLVRQARQGA
ncbi:response regulator transcription factor [Szabonella alba]|uniref:Response regulator transcription factor n=1 Tax=Szabonella alba TaxID=2804194 RepID=A0A8K0Y1G5_9RHOB|nr:response regulator transcription factor [Szabonella alba]MBL4918841.1 response regulator transcription factor [Szabonella alba]